MPWSVIVFFIGVAGGVWWWTHDRPISQPPGIVAPEEPLQENLEPPPRFEANGYTFYKRAHYDITARVLRRENYHIDGGANLAPVDLAVGWGPLSDSAVIDQLEITQMGRFFFWKPKDPQRMPVPFGTMITHAAQMHIIPSTREIESRVKRLHPGQVITIEGYLVDIRGPQGFTWNTSLTRNDTGAGACEIVWVESLRVR